MAASSRLLEARTRVAENKEADMGVRGVRSSFRGGKPLKAFQKPKSQPRGWEEDDLHSAGVPLEGPLVL